MSHLIDDGVKNLSLNSCVIQLLDLQELYRNLIQFILFILSKIPMRNYNKRLTTQLLNEVWHKKGFHDKRGI